MQSPLEKLSGRIFKKKNAATKITGIIDMVREFGCLSEIIGRDFEIRNPNGELVYLVRQKPISVGQLQTLMKEFEILKKMDFEKEKAMFGGKGKKPMRR